MGTREVVDEVEEPQPNGKNFKKFILGKYEWRSFARFRSDARAAGDGLRALGVRAGDRVAILAETRADWLTAAYGCFQNGVSLVTLYTNLGNDGVRHALNETEVSCLFCSVETLPKVRAIAGDCPALATAVVFESPSPKDPTAAEAGAGMTNVKVVPYGDLLTMSDSSPRVPPKPDDCAIIMYTSGSTGNPKGVMLSHRNLIHAMSGLINIAKFKPRDR